MQIPIHANWKAPIRGFVLSPLGEVADLADGMAVVLEVDLVLVLVLVVDLVALDQERLDAIPGTRMAVFPPISFHLRNAAWIVASIGTLRDSALPKDGRATTVANWAISWLYVNPLLL